MGEDQLDIGKAFFRSATLEGDKINGHRFEPAPETGAPCWSTQHERMCGRRD
jgi:hypothetical protein